jgi:hypothetical protein
MKTILDNLVPVLALALLSAGWVALQFLARKAGTKNHFDHQGGSTCDGCTCGSGGTCDRPATD